MQNHSSPSSAYCDSATSSYHRPLMHRPLEHEGIVYGDLDPRHMRDKLVPTHDLPSVYILPFNDSSNLPWFKTVYPTTTYAKHPSTTMPLSLTQYPVSISSSGRGKAVSVQWTDWRQVKPRIYPTPGDAALALGWSEDLAIEAIDQTATLHTYTSISYDEIGKQSIQGESASCLGPLHCGPH